jgi:hypothetical protein
MKNKLIMVLAVCSMVYGWVPSVRATQTWLVLRDESPQVIHSGLTDQVLDTTFGTNQATLPFTGTATYDFYSPRLTTSVSLSTTDKGGGVIFMSNDSVNNVNNFSVTGEMKYFDYDPATGNETLIVDTTASVPKAVNQNQTVNWSTPTLPLPVAITIPAGHMIHVAMTLALVSGNPGSHAKLIYNGPQGDCTAAQLPQNRALFPDWPLDAASVPTLSIFPQSNGQMVLGYYGAPQSSVSIQATTNLTAPDWVMLVTTNTDLHGVFNFVDQDAPIYPCRFYRASTP